MRVHACVGVCARACTGAGVCLCVCSLTYPACHSQAPYCLRPLWMHHIFRHSLINGTIFGRTLLNMKYVFWFSLQRLFETLLVLRRIYKMLFLSDLNFQPEVGKIFNFWNVVFLFKHDAMNKFRKPRTWNEICHIRSLLTLTTSWLVVTTNSQVLIHNVIILITNS